MHKAYNDFLLCTYVCYTDLMLCVISYCSIVLHAVSLQKMNKHYIYIIVI